MPIPKAFCCCFQFQLMLHVLNLYVMRKWKYGTQSLRSGNPWLATTSSLPSSRDQPKFLPTLGTYQNWSLWVHTTYIPKDIVTSLRYVKDDKSIWRQRPPCPYSHPADHKEGLPLQRKRMDHSSGEVIWQPPILHSFSCSDNWMSIQTFECINFSICPGYQDLPIIGSN